MPKCLLLLAAFLSVSALPQDLPSSSAAVQPFVPDASQSFDLDLDTAKAAFSEWRHDNISSLSALKAVVRIRVLRNDRKWLPAFAIWVQGTEGGKITNRLGIQLTPARKKKPPLGIRIVEFDGHHPVKTDNSSVTVGLDQDLPIEIVWREPHVITIRIGDSEIHSVSVGWSVDSVGVTASTGEMKVDPLVLGNRQ